MNPIEVIMLAIRGVFDVLLNTHFMGISWATFLVGFFILRVMSDFIRGLFGKYREVNRDEIKEYNESRNRVWKNIFRR